MKYDLLFYLSRKTSYCEKVIKKALRPINLEANRIISCTTSIELGKYTCESLNLCNLVVIVGGLNANGTSNLETILSRVLSASNLSLNNSRKLKSKNAFGYIIKYKKQIILALPDSPKDVEEILNKDFIEFLKKSYT